MDRTLFQTVNIFSSTWLLLIFVVVALGSGLAFAATCRSVDCGYDGAWTSIKTNNAGAEAYIYEDDPRICTGETGSFSGA